MTTFLDKIRGRTRVVISETERALHICKGELQGILGPGEHSLKNGGGTLVVERQSITAMPQFRSTYEKALFDKLPQVAEEHLTVIRTGPGEVAVVERDNRIHTVLGPDERLVLWTDAGPWTFEVIDTAADPALTPKLRSAQPRSRTSRAGSPRTPPGPRPRPRWSSTSSARSPVPRCRIRGTSSSPCRRG